MGGNSVIWNVMSVPPCPSPAIAASSDRTSVNEEGRVVVSDPIIGTTVSAFALALAPVPSSYSTACCLPVTFFTVYLTVSVPVLPTTAPGSTGLPSNR